MGLGAAILGGAAISGVASAVGANQQAGAAKHAANLQQQMFDTTQANLHPFIQAGTGSLSQLQNLLGLGTQGQAGINAALTQTPGYQFQFNQGQQSLLDARSATGGVRGGNTLKALTSFGQGEAQGQYQQSLANYSNLASLGENAAAGLGNQSVQAGANIANATVGAGNAQSAGTIGVGNAAQGAANNFLLASLSGQGGGNNAQSLADSFTGFTQLPAGAGQLPTLGP